MKTRHRKLHAITWFVLAPVLLLMTWLALMSGQMDGQINGQMSGKPTQPVNQALTPELIRVSTPKGPLP